MIFLNELYHMESARTQGETFVRTVRLNPEHVIYGAHFPGMPITPGVCILQTGVELLSDAVAEELELTGVKNMKFLNVLTPDCGTVDFVIHDICRDGQEMSARIDVNTSELTIAKMSLKCRIASK